LEKIEVETESTEKRKKRRKNWKWRLTFFLGLMTMMALARLINTFEYRMSRAIFLPLLAVTIVGIAVFAMLLFNTFFKKLYSFSDVRQKLADIIFGNLLGTIFLLVIIFILILIIEFPLSFINELTFQVNDLSIRFISVLMVTVAIVYFGEEIVKSFTSIIETEEGKEIEVCANDVLRRLKLRQKMYILIALVYFVYSIEQLNGRAIINFEWWRSFFPIVQNVAITFIAIDTFLRNKVRRAKRVK